MGERVDNLEQVENRLGDLNSCMDSLRAEFNQLRVDMHARFDKIDRKFNYLYLLVGGGWVTTMASIIGLALAS